MVVSGKIDRERFAWMNLTAKASDSGMPRRSSFVPVFIQAIRVLFFVFSPVIALIVIIYLSVKIFVYRFWTKTITTHNLLVYQVTFQYEKTLHLVSKNKKIFYAIGDFILSNNCCLQAL